MPFCSDRCRLIDLGNWASGTYVISTSGGADELEEMPDPQSQPEEPKGPIQ
jgi:hypothetical protein